ncbi:tRNA pseudouridine(38-40) synthase TruA [Thermocrinis sp.]
MFNYCLLLSFLGSNFHGWQIQPNLRTVQGVLEDALSLVFKEELRVIGCCRTDAGVHAKEYIANFKASRCLPLPNLLKALNSILPEDMGVKKVWLESLDFSSRYSVKGKLYIYRVFPSHIRDPFIEPFLWRIPYSLNVDAMSRASELFLGTHDFSAFAKLDEEEKNPFVDIEECSVEKKDGIIEIRIKAKRFLRYMVRRIAGCLIYLGMGKLNTDDVREFLSGRRCPYTAKAKGLTLERVFL